MKPRILITGGAGFIGANLALYYLNKGTAVHIFDNFSRCGSKDNLSYLKKNYPRNLLKVTRGDIGDFSQVKKAVRDAEVVYHLAGQVAVVTSFRDPKGDFEANAGGTVNVLEAGRVTGKPLVVFASTNKVYGQLQQHGVSEREFRYEFKKSIPGIDEDEPLNFPSPYACSKGVAEIYVREYFNTYKLPIVVFRQSCIYGPFQNGIVEQGWIAYITRQALEGATVTLFGSGKQVRDLLYVEDLISAYIAASRSPKAVGQVYNVGGGVKNSLSIVEYLKNLESLLGRSVNYTFGKERPGDQKVYYTNTTKIETALGWKPKVGFNEGIKKLLSWLKERKHE